MGSPDFEYFGPPEATDSDQSTTGSLAQQTGGGFKDTSGGEDLNGQRGNMNDKWEGYLRAWGIIGAILQLVIDLFVALSEWLAGLFEGLSNQAKTAGTGSRLVHSDDLVTQWIGAQLIAGAAADHTLSEPNWPQNFGGRVLALGGAMIEFVNREPPAKFWKVRNTPARAIARFHDGPRQFRIGPVEPPKGANYSQWITIDGFFSEFVRDRAAYKAQFGFDWPTPQQLLQFLRDGGGIGWNDPGVHTGLLWGMRKRFLDLWVQRYQEWLNKNPPIPPGPQPDPCGLPEDPPCPPPTTNQGDQLTDFIGAESTYLYYIARSLTRLAEASGSPQDAVCCANVVGAIQTVSRQLGNLEIAIREQPETPVDLTAIVAALGQLLDAVRSWPALWGAAANLLGGKLDGIASAIGNVAAAADPKEISQQLAKWNEINDIPPEMLSQFVQDKVVPPQYAKFMQGSPAEWIKAILLGPSLISSPTDVIKLLSGDSSDLTGAPKAAYEDLVRRAPAIFAGSKALLHAGAGDFQDLIKAGFSKYLSANDVVFEPVVKGLVEAIQQQLKPRAGAATSIGDIGVDPDAPVSAATGIAFSAAIAGWVASFAEIDGGESLTKIVELFAGAVGFEELRDVQIGPLIRNGIAAVADMKAKATFRQHLPGIGEVTSLTARGLVARDQAEQLLPFHGVRAGMFPALFNGAYHGLQARQMIRAFESGLFNADDLTDEMTFSGMRPASQHRMQLLAPYLATQSARSQLRSAIEAAYEAGLLSDSDFDARMDGSQHNVDGASLHRAAVQLKKHIALAKEMETAYIKLYECGIADSALTRSQLQAIGLQDDKVNSLMAVAQATRTCTLKREADANERTLVRETVAAERKAAIENYKRGTIGIPELAAALIATGLNATQAAAWTDLIVLQKAGAQRWIYGLLKTPQQAELLQQRIAALIDQRKKEFIDGSAFVKALQELGIPEHFQNALLARANAGITPKKDAFATPVGTS